jgi:hypothetical protein
VSAADSQQLFSAAEQLAAKNSLFSAAGPWPPKMTVAPVVIIHGLDGIGKKLEEL